MSGHAIARLQRVLGRVGRNSGLFAREVSLLPRHWEWLEQQPNGTSGAIRRLTMQESGIRMSSKPVQRSKLLADSCPPWQGIYLDMKRRAGLYTPATRNGFTNSLGNGLEIFAYTRTTSSVAPSEKTIIGLCILTGQVG